MEITIVKSVFPTPLSIAAAVSTAAAVSIASAAVSTAAVFGRNNLYLTGCQ
jgi:hypothetical protein